MEAQGSFVPGGVCWRKLDGEILAGIAAPGGAGAGDPTPMICLPLNKLSQALQNQINQLPHIQILFNHKVIDIGQDENQAWVKVETANGLQTYEALYIVGCDGANSQVRRSLFGDWEFPGFTWDQQIVATNVCMTRQYASLLEAEKISNFYFLLDLLPLRGARL
jgi:2-polyprenyl-6-methoxyphenol hydroxylase-like FAD-dependent oxidoreductase